MPLPSSKLQNFESVQTKPKFCSHLWKVPKEKLKANKVLRNLTKAKCYTTKSLWNIITFIHSYMCLNFDLGNYKFDICVFHHCFWIMSPKFLIFERVQNFARYFWIAWKRNCEITKLNKIGWNFDKLKNLAMPGLSKQISIPGGDWGITI